MTFEIPVRVYIEDTDAGGIVFYANYLKFFERARTDFLRSQGITQSETMQTRQIFVVRRVAVDYQKPARLDDVLRVTCAVHACSRARVIFRQRACLPDGTQLVHAEVEVASVSMDTLKPMAMAKWQLQQLKPQVENTDD